MSELTFAFGFSLLTKPHGMQSSIFRKVVAGRASGVKMGGRIG